MDTLMVIHFRNVRQLESFINFLRKKLQIEIHPLRREGL